MTAERPEPIDMTNAQFWAYLETFIVRDDHGLVNHAATRAALVADGWDSRTVKRITDKLARGVAWQRIETMLAASPPARLLVTVTMWLARKLARHTADAASRGDRE